jgi:hypothetical protein
MCLSIIVDRPDVLIEKGTYQDYQYVIAHNGRGYRCGYIKLQPDHPWSSKDTLNINAAVHGGINFGKPDKPCEDNLHNININYWIGFSCDHLYDGIDPSLSIDKKYKPWVITHKLGTIRTTEYVRDQIKELIYQAMKLYHINNYEYTIYYD